MIRRTNTDVPRGGGYPQIGAIAAITWLLLIPALRAAEPPGLQVDKDGTVHVPAHQVPLSNYLSEEARRAYLDKIRPIQPLPNASAEEQAKLWSEIFFEPRLERAKRNYSVTISQESLGGVRVDVVTPLEKIPSRNRARVLIELHGGTLTGGYGNTSALIESIPVAALGKIKVIAVDYGKGPEDRFPRASEDVTAVYRELLKRYKPRNIGIYGCSAGGMLTGMELAWLQGQNLPRPGAAGIFCAPAAAIFGGDSRYFAAPLMAEAPPPAQPNPVPLPLDYLSQADLNDPLVSPLSSPAVLAEFPPTLLITGTRSYELSSVVFTHRQLIKAGVTAELHVWDGMWHGFLYDVQLPESQEAFGVMVRFFDRYLGT